MYGHSEAAATLSAQLVLLTWCKCWLPCKSVAMLVVVEGNVCVKAVHPLKLTVLRAQGSWVRQAARDAGVPIFVVKTAAPSNLTRALRTLLGFDPSAGGTFVGWHERNSRNSSLAPGMGRAGGLPGADYSAADSSNVSSRVIMRVGRMP